MSFGTSALKQPKVECHAPAVIHSKVRSSSHIGSKYAEDTVKPPIKVRAIGQTSFDTKQKPKGKYVQSRYLSTSSGNLSTSRVNVSKNDAKTSTPASKKPVGRLELDVSDIKNCSVSHGSKSIADKKAKKPSVDVSIPVIKKTLLSAKTTKSGTHEKAKKLDKNDDDMLLQYNEYLQYKFLNAQLEHAGKQRNSQGMAAAEVITKMHMDEKEKQFELEKEIMRLKHLDKLRTYLSEQNEYLEPITDKLPEVEKSFIQLTENLDTTCHRLPLKNVCEIDENAIIGTLKETKHLLGEANILIQSKSDIINKMAESTDALANQVKECTIRSEKATHAMANASRNLVKLQSLVAQNATT